MHRHSTRGRFRIFAARSAALAALLFCGAAPLAALAAPLETIEDENGTLNPQELTMDYFARRVSENKFDPKMCIYGYPAAKMGNHVLARKIFERCSKEGVLGAMPWMAWTEENGYDKPSDPVKAAEWDKRSADAGWPVGQLNYGLDLLRGHGVALDPIKGRIYVDRAVQQGDADARTLAEHGYDPEVVTPDADRDRYRHRLY